MTAVDTNVLIYSHRKDAPQHRAAKDCVMSLADAPAKWAIPWPCIHEFIAVVTNPRVFRPPSTLEEAITQVEVWRESPSLTLISETEVHWLYLKQTLTDGKIVGPMTHDARIAAICRQHGVTKFLSADRDFARFPELRVVNPLAQ